MARHLMISIILFIAALVGVILIIESVTYGDEQDRRVDRAEIRRLMEYHGTDCIYEVNGQLYFDRNGQAIRIRREP